jgi:glutaredoxin-related protein/cytochrome c biogenesis protein CcdA
MRKIVFLTLFLLMLLPFFVLAQENIEVNFFYSSTCPHCAKEEKFLDELQEKYPSITINRYLVNERENIDLLKQYYNDYDVSKEHYGMVPATFTNNKYFVGFNEKIGKDIEECIIECQMGSSSKTDTTIIDIEGNIRLPIIGEINVKNYSLPVLAVVLGTLDGFNVCSLGALVLILGLVLAFKSRKKVLFFGGLFILTTTVIYALLIVAWYKVFTLFISYMNLMQFLVGVLGIAGGVYFFKTFLKFRKYGPNCEVSSGGIITKLSAKFQKSFKESASIILLLVSIFLFAVVVTIIEFPCSAVVPVAFAGVLAQAGLSSFQYLIYISLFALFYMLDEIIVFLIAFFSMKIWLASSKVVTWITLAESIILFALGFYYLFSIFS